MKKLILLFTILILHSQGAFTQGTYVPIPKENYATFYGDCDLDVKLPQNAPWYVFSDREDNQIFSTANGTTVVKSANLGDGFLVIGSSGDRLQVIEAEKTIYDMSDRTWKFRNGTSSSSVLQGWIPREKLLLNQKCLKVCNVGLPSAPTGMFNLQGLYVYNVGNATTNDRYFSHVPGSLKRSDEQNASDRFGYIYKVKRIGTIDWYLIGQTDEIRVGDQRKVLRGWKPQNQIELWKHRLALEYDWENPQYRANNDIRLKVLKREHLPNINLPVYRDAEFVDIESNGSQCSSFNNFYFSRDKGEIFRHVLLTENGKNYKVGVLKNTSTEDKRVIACALHVANEIKMKLFKPKVIFLLDGTQSLTPQIPNILGTIDSTCTIVRRYNLGKSIEYEYAASIYRDEKYVNRYENMNNFTPVVANVTNWISSNLPHTQGTDCDQAEAIFYGLNRTIDYYEGLPQKSFFNPSFYVLIGDAGSHDPDMEGVTAEMIKTKLKSNVSDLVAIQFSHKLDGLSCGKPDLGASFDLFRTQFQDILSIYGNSKEGPIVGGSKIYYPSRLGSFLAYPAKGKAFGANDLSLVIKESLENYNSTIQEKIIYVATILRGNTNTSQKAKDEILQMIGNQNCVIGEDCKTRVLEWVIRFIENAAKEIDKSIQISSADANFFNSGYVCSNYDFLRNPPYKHVIYMNSNSLDRILEFSGRIARLQGGNIRPMIQHIWQYMLITSLGIYQTPAQVNALTISQATSLLTGFKSNTIYDDIHIGEITAAGKFPNDLLFRYVFEWAITNRYLQSIKNGSWELTQKNLTSLQPIINAIQKGKGKPSITPAQIAALSTRLVRKDNRSLGEYFKEYPQEVLDPLYKLKAYWIEADFFSTKENDFINMLPN